MTRDTLAGSEVVFRALMEAAPDGTVIVNQEGRIVLVNLQTGPFSLSTLARKIRTIFDSEPAATVAAAAPGGMGPPNRKAAGLPAAVSQYPFKLLA